MQLNFDECMRHWRIAVQALLMQLLDQWTETGFEQYVLTMQAEYQRRAAILHAAVEKGCHAKATPSA